MNRYFISIFLLLAILISSCKADESSLNFFHHPELVTREMLEQLDAQALDMCWQFGRHDFFRFTTKKNEVYFEILFETIPDFYDETTKNLLIEKIECLEGIEKKYHLFSYEYKTDKSHVLINQPRKPEKSRGSNTPAYLVDTRRIFEHATPQQISENELAAIICNQNILFYTGAGISVASGVPSMNQLNDLLGLKKGNELSFSLNAILQHPEKFVEKILSFHHACFLSPPTEAHHALKQLALFKNTKIVTENLDHLHEYSGILPYRIHAQQLREEVGAAQLSDISYMICIGLSYDDKGFLGWYKNNNPHGKIISVDLGDPSYLGDDDFIIHTDLQQLLPSLARKILISSEREGVS